MALDPQEGTDQHAGARLIVQGCRQKIPSQPDQFVPLCHGALVEVSGRRHQHVVVLIQRDQADAWEHYMAYTRQGGSVTFKELLANAGMVSPFDETCLRGICERASKWLEDCDLSDVR